MTEYINDTINEYLKNATRGEGNKYPWHMPGHKRKKAPWADSCEPEGEMAHWADSCGSEEEAGGMDVAKTDVGTLFGRDFTEVPGLDELHHPEEMIKQSMEEVAKVYGSFKTYYLVNGSTSGNLAAIFACTALKQDSGRKKAIIIARNCHKSVFNAVSLLDVKPIYIYPSVSNEISIDGCIDPADIQKAVEKNTNLDICGCVITSPTYEGVISDIKSISEILHMAGIPLIVDEAHGAHFPFYVSGDLGCEHEVGVFIESGGIPEQSVCIESGGAREEVVNENYGDVSGQIDNNINSGGYAEAACDDHGNALKNGYPVSALYLGADIVVESLHKTLPCYTQTAVLHIADDNFSTAGSSQDNEAQMKNINKTEDIQTITGCRGDNNTKKKNSSKKCCNSELLAESVEKYLRIFQSSSPSYIFLQAMEKCISWCSDNRLKFREHFERILRFRRRIADAGFRNVKPFEFTCELGVLSTGGAFEMSGTAAITQMNKRYTGKYSSVYTASQDSTRLVFMVRGISGKKAAEILEAESGIVVEMAGADYVTAISTVMDSEEDFEYLFKALKKLDEMIDILVQQLKEKTETGKNQNPEDQTGALQTIMVSTEDGEIPLDEAAGKRITDYLYVYPPGIPIVAPFEIIEERHIAEIKHDIIAGFNIYSKG
ncbi:MAG: DegT/DnrJ/EryC1/StrS family aminotransferase [Eubacterium sp.]|nr:DegT/DnrJ/EryC1/StrS family aminotransferase [Eubacterium sp.]